MISLGLIRNHIPALNSKINLGVTLYSLMEKVCVYLHLRISTFVYI